MVTDFRKKTRSHNLNSGKPVAVERVVTYIYLTTEDRSILDKFIRVG